VSIKPGGARERAPTEPCQISAFQPLVTIGCNTAFALLFDWGGTMKDRARKVVICGGVVIASALAVAFAIHDRTASDPYTTGTVQIARQGTSCQRLVIDHSTGAITSSQQVPCGNPPKIAPASNEAAPPPRYSSGSRVDAIRDSFLNR